MFSIEIRARNERKITFLEEQRQTPLWNTRVLAILNCRQKWLKYYRIFPILPDSQKLHLAKSFHKITGLRKSGQFEQHKVQPILFYVKIYFLWSFCNFNFAKKKNHIAQAYTHIYLWLILFLFLLLNLIRWKRLLHVLALYKSL